LQLAPILNEQHFEYHFAQPAVGCGRSVTSEEQTVWGGTGSGITTLGAKVQASQPVGFGPTATHLLQAAPGCQNFIETRPAVTLKTLTFRPKGVYMCFFLLLTISDNYFRKQH